MAGPLRYRLESREASRHRSALAEYKKSSSPFGSSPSGQSGVPGSEWSTKHLQYLSIDFYQNCDLFQPRGVQDLGLISKDYKFSPNRSVCRQIKSRFGAVWSDIENAMETDLSDMYVFLRRLHAEQPIHPPQVASSSLASSSPSARTQWKSSPDDHEMSMSLGSGGREREIKSSPPEPGEAWGPRAYSPGATMSRRTFDARLPSSSRPKSRPAVISGAAGSAAMAVPGSTQSVLSSSPPPAPLSDDSDISWEEETSSDSAPQPAHSYEDDVRTAVETCLVEMTRSVGATMNGPHWMFEARAPQQYAIIVDGFPCSCKPDHEIEVQPRTQASDKERIAHIYVEDKRFKHSKPLDNILGQEVAYLVSLLFMRNTRRESRSAPKEDKDLHAYLVSWHHLTAYITRIDAKKSKLDSIAHELKRTQGEPFVVRRSSLFDMKDAEQRVEFFSTLASLMFAELSRYGSLARQIKALYDERPGDARK